MLKRPDTAVVVTSFGSEPRRVRANVTGLRRQLFQDLAADVYLVEVLHARESQFPQDVLSRVHQITVRGGDSSNDLFQKEALFNLGWQSAAELGDYEHFVFVDADVYALELDWFGRIREKLLEDPAKAVQGFRVVSDPVDSEFRRTSVTSALLTPDGRTGPLNPGVCWGLHRDVLAYGGGFNPYYIDCAGDGAFVAEYLCSPDFRYEPLLFGFRWYRELARDLPFRAKPDCVPIDLVHVHHGPATERNYHFVRYAIDGMPPVRTLVELGGDGILHWRDPECIERQILRRRAQMRSVEAVDAIFQELGYERRQGCLPPARTPQEKALFPVGRHLEEHSLAVLSGVC